MKIKVFIIAIGLIVLLTGCNWFYSLNKMECYKNVSIKLESGNLIVYNSGIFINLDGISNLEKECLDFSKKYNVYIKDNEYYFLEVQEGGE